MTTLREAATQALEALEDFGMKHYENTGEVLHRDVYESLKEALVEPGQGPVAWMNTEDGFCTLDSPVEGIDVMSQWVPLYIKEQL